MVKIEQEERENNDMTLNKKCVLCKVADNGMKHVINECTKLKNEREDLLKELNRINKRKYKSN